jgi:hypothetical protein
LDSLRKAAAGHDSRAFDYFDEYTKSELAFSNLDMALVQGWI